MGTQVKLRQKPISGNRQSLYLDFYPPIKDSKTGSTTRRQFLNLFLFNEIKHETLKYFDKKGKPQIRIVPVLNKKNIPIKVSLNPFDQKHNAETLEIAKGIRDRRYNEINKPEVYSGYEKEQLRIKGLGEGDFIKYFKKLANKRKGSVQANWMAALAYLEKFTKGRLKFSDLNDNFCNEFKDYIKETTSIRSSKTEAKILSNNSASSYYNKFKAALKQAYKDGYILTDLNSKIESIKEEDSQREFLTLEELKQLMKTDCPNAILKQASLFSALTGLRFSDIFKLTWNEVQSSNELGNYIRIITKKTKDPFTLSISDQAFNLLGNHRQSSERVFEGLTYSMCSNAGFHLWIVKAGIQKHITFHAFRHTYATLQLTLGTDIYTVSNLLNHKDLKTTAIYAKIIDRVKRDAANKMNFNF
jgi:integrase